MAIDFAECRSVPVPDGNGGVAMSPPPPHVKEGVLEVVRKPAFLLADEMGGMKSAQAIIAAQYLWMEGHIDRVVVVAPVSVRDVWFDPEIGQLALHLFTPAAVVEVHSDLHAWSRTAEGPPKPGIAREFAAGPKLSWMVTNYEWLRTNAAVLAPQCGPKTLLVLDESSAVSNWKSRQHKACLDLRRRCGRVLLLNGTPAGENPEAIFAQANLMDRRILDCPYITEFRGRYSVRAAVLGRGGEPLKVRVRGGREVDVTKAVEWVNLEDLSARMAPYTLRRLTKECLGLPPALPPVPRTVKATAETWRVYRGVRDDLLATLEGGSAALVEHAATKVLRLAQVTSGFIGGVLDLGLPGEGGFELTAPDDDFLRSLDLDGRGDGMTAQGDTRWEDLPNELPPRIAREEVIGREKLDSALEQLAEHFAEDPGVKVLLWCRFVPELRRLLREAAARFPEAMIGAVSGQPCLEGVTEHGGSVKSERAWATRLLHPATAPRGPAIVGGTFGTGALGLNFTACHTVVVVSAGYSQLKADQAAARVDRPGQLRPVRTTDLVMVGPKGQRTIDHLVTAARQGKREIAELLAAPWTRPAALAKALREE